MLLKYHKYTKQKSVYHKSYYNQNVFLSCHSFFTSIPMQWYQSPHDFVDIFINIQAYPYIYVISNYMNYIYIYIYWEDMNFSIYTLTLLTNQEYCTVWFFFISLGNNILLSNTSVFNINIIYLFSSYMDTGIFLLLYLYQEG